MLDETLVARALHTYAEIARASYEDSLRAAVLLEQRVEEFLAAPSAATFESARAAWLSARYPYAQSEVFRFYDGPIDQVELLVNTWPIDESYVESEGEHASLGILQDRARYPELSALVLTELNGRDGETAISTGYHVIEFLLWGRDENPLGPGQRSFRDFDSAIPSQPRSEAALATRRGVYLHNAIRLLVGHLRGVTEAWDGDGQANYRARFLAQPRSLALYRALKGMAKLSGPELAGERLTVPYETKNQENEHSCFSDSTQADIAANALGVQNVCLGRYRRSDGSQLTGAGLCEALTRASPELGKLLQRQVADSVRRTREIPAPFDRAILGTDQAPSRLAIARAIEALRAQADTLERLRARLSLSDPAQVSIAP